MHAADHQCTARSDPQARLRDVEKHRNAWLILAVSLGGVGSALLSRSNVNSGFFYAAAVVCFLLAVRQVRFPFLRGSEGALLYRELQRLYVRIGEYDKPTEEEAQEIAAETLAVYRTYVPHYLPDAQRAIERAGEQGPAVTLSYLRQGIRNTLERLEMGGGT
jgi:hypothetical protein